MYMGILGNLFDFNGDGDLDIFEQATEFAFLDKMLQSANEEKSTEDVLDSEDYDSYHDF